MLLLLFAMEYRIFIHLTEDVTRSVTQLVIKSGDWSEKLYQEIGSGNKIVLDSRTPVFTW